MALPMHRSLPLWSSTTATSWSAARTACWSGSDDQRGEFAGPGDFQREVDEIAVFMADRFAALKFKVEGASINLNSLKVFYEDGTVEDVTGTFPYAIQTPGESKVIDLKGTERELKKVQFTYSTLEHTGVKKDNSSSANKDKKAKVELWGLKTNVIEGDKTKDKKTSDIYKDDKRQNQNNPK